MHIGFSLPGPKLELETKIREIKSAINQTWPFGANCYKGIVWLPGQVAIDSNLTSYKFYLKLVGLVTEDNGLVAWGGYCRLSIRVLF